MKVIKSLIVCVNKTELVFELPLDNYILDVHFYNNKLKTNKKFHPMNEMSFNISFLTEENSNDLYIKEYKIFYDNEKVPTNSLYIKSFYDPFIFHLFEIINKFQMPIARPA